jgi:hypothetical protein
MRKAQLILVFMLASTILAGLMATVESRAEVFGNRYIYIKANPAESICTSTLYFGH